MRLVLEVKLLFSTHSLVFKADLNKDWVVADTREKMTYRYDPET